MPSISTADLLAALRRRWWLVVLVAAPLVLFAQRYAASLPDEYESFAVVSLTLEPDASVSSDLIRLEAQRYAVTLASPASMNAVAAELSLEPGDVEDGVEVTTPPDTGNVRIAVRGETPELPARIANRLAARGEAEARDDPILRVVIAAPAVPARHPAGPARGMLVAAGLLLAALAGAALVMLLERSRPVVHGLGTLRRHVRQHRVLGQAALAGPGRLPARDADSVDSAVRRVQGLLPQGFACSLTVVGTTADAGSDTLVAALGRDWSRLQYRTADGGRLELGGFALLPDRALLSSSNKDRSPKAFRASNGGNVGSADAHVTLLGADAVVLLVRRETPLRSLERALDQLDERQVNVLGVWLTTPRPRDRARRRVATAESRVQEGGSSRPSALPASQK